MDISAATLWFTGLPCIGKTTTAKAVYRRLKDAGLKLEMLDSDDVVCWFDGLMEPNAERRDVVSRAMAFTALSLNRSGIHCVCAATTPRRRIRDAHRKMLPGYLEIWCRGDVATARQRDSCRLYELADAGFIRGFTGVDEAYEAPDRPDLTLDMESLSPDEGADAVIRFLQGRRPELRITI